MSRTHDLLKVLELRGLKQEVIHSFKPYDLRNPVTRFSLEERLGNIDTEIIRLGFKP